MSAPLWQPRTDGAARLLGLGGAVGGAGLLYWQLLLPLQQARAGQERLTYSLTLIVFGVLWLLLGLFWLVRGRAGYDWVRSAQHRRGPRTALLVATAVVVLALRFLLSRQLVALGYSE